MYRACFDVEISDRENPAKSQSLSAGSVVLVIWNHIYGKCFSSFGLEINTLLGENIFTVGEKTGFSWFFRNLISIIWELREKEYNVTSITFFIFLKRNLCKIFKVFLQCEMSCQVLPLFFNSLLMSFDFTYVYFHKLCHVREDGCSHML